MPSTSAVELAAVVEIDRDHVAVEDIAPGGENMPLAADQKAALIRFQPAKPAGAEDLDDLGLRLGDDFG